MWVLLQRTGLDSKDRVGLFKAPNKLTNYY